MRIFRQLLRQKLAIHFHLQGDIAGILDNTGALAVEYRYDAWENLSSTTEMLADTLGKRNFFRYCGYVYEEDII